MKTKKVSFNIRKTVFWPALFLFYSFIIIFMMDPNAILQNLSKLQNHVLDAFGKVYQIGVFIIFILSCYLYVGPLRHIRIGGEKAKPIVNKYEWFYITLCTVTAAAILFWTCSEPLYHLHDPSLNLSTNFSYPNSETIVLALMYFHWSFIPYCIYLIPTVVVALSILQANKPMSFGSSLNLFFVKPCSDKLINFVDALCLITLITGMSSSLAVGVYMIASAMNNVFSLQETPLLKGLICFSIVTAFVGSAASGLLKGIRFFSQINTKIFYLLGIFVLLAGPTTFILSNGFYSFGFYLKNFFNLTLFSHQFFPETWFKNWTILHWGSWLSWAPMTGLFLARLAYGYTIKEMIQIQVILPGLFTCLWIAIFSSSTLYFDQENGHALLNLLEQKGPQAILFHIFTYLPGTAFMHFVLLIIIFISFVTAADSNTEAISSLCLKDKQSISSKTSWFIKIFWGTSIGFISWIMVVYTGVDGMRIVNYLGGIPALFLILIFVLGLLKLSLQKYWTKNQ